MESGKQTGNAAGRVEYVDGAGGLPMVKVATKWSSAEMYLHGAHVTHFQKTNEQPMLFMSGKSRFEDGQPFRGGIPVIFPWFGAKEGQKLAHGFARIKSWKMKEVVHAPNGAVSLHLHLPECPGFTAEYVVTVGETLKLQLLIKNISKERFTFENCLHTYFQVGDVAKVSVSGLKGVTFRDKVENFAEKKEEKEAIRVESEVDRVYQDTTDEVKIEDASLARTILVKKSGSASTVVWNPWIAKSKQMADFGDEEYHKMICVESGNVGKNSINLSPDETSTLTVELSSIPRRQSLRVNLFEVGFLSYIL